MPKTPTKAPVHFLRAPGQLQCGPEVAGALATVHRAIVTCKKCRRALNLGPDTSWAEFQVSVQSGRGEITICGLCGNSGWIRVLPPPPACGLMDGALMPLVEGFCICPNGRTRKSQKSGLRPDPRCEG